MKIAAAAIISVIFVASPSLAEEHASARAGVVTSAQPPSPRAMELARRLVAAFHMKDQYESVVKAFVGDRPQVDCARETDVNSGDCTLVNEVRKTIRSVKNSWAAEQLEHQSEGYARVYAEVFTEQELADQVAFFESRTGQAVLEKTPLLLSRTKGVLASGAKISNAELTSRVCAKITKRTECLKYMAATLRGSEP